MNVKRAIWISILAYITTFIVGIITATIMGIDLESASTLPSSVWFVTIILSAVVIGAFSFWYFKKVKPSAKEGLLLGITFIIVGTVLDIAIIIPYILASDSPSDIMAYYANPMFWVSLLIVIAAAAGVGHYLQKKK
tara:strand:+ start:7567 stop:7974 length:408 start_codon:yes stop_codon:yes gene_type:complete